MNKKYVLVMTVIGTGLVGGYTRASETDLHSRALDAKQKYEQAASPFPEIPKLALDHLSPDAQIEKYTWYAKSLENLLRINPTPRSIKNRFSTPTIQEEAHSWTIDTQPTREGSVVIAVPQRSLKRPQSPTSTTFSLRKTLQSIAGWFIGNRNN